MTNNQQQISGYLAELTKELAGQPAGLIQDACYDTECHLLDALADSDTSNLDAIIASYGTPAEVARQYIELEAQTQQFLCGAQRQRREKGYFTPLFDSRSYQQVGYFILAWPLSLLYFAWFIIAGVSCLALSVVGVGLPLLAFYLKLQRYIGMFEGKLISTLLGERMPRRPDISDLDGQSPSYFKNMSRYLTTPLGWKIALYTALQLPLTSLYFALCVGLFFASIALLLSPVIDPLLHYFYPALAIDINWYWLPLCLPAGVISLTLSLYIANALSNLHRAISRALLIN